MLDEELGQTMEYIVRVQSSLDDNGHAPPGKLIDHGEHAELPPIVCSIHDEVIGPDVIGPSTAADGCRIRRVGLRIARFEACSAFTRVAARMVAEPPKAARYTEVLQSKSLPPSTAPIATRLERLLPGGIRTR